MKAIVFHGPADSRFETVEDPRIEHPKDAIVRIMNGGWIFGHLINGLHAQYAIAVNAYQSSGGKGYQATPSSQTTPRLAS